ncbi:MAG: diguanylate cyclase [Elusimicrobia bacterium]|nr:diguanylate cyclase [Elusimicrobiota bacterium]
MKKPRDTWVFFLLLTAFLALCFSLLAFPDLGTTLFPLLGVLIIAVSWLMGPGVSALLVLLGTLICFGLWNLWPSDQRAFLFFGVVQLWGIWSFLRSWDLRSLQERFQFETVRQGHMKKEEDLKKDIEFYKRHTEKMKAESAHRQYLATCAKDLGAVLDGAEIQARLLPWVKRFFPDSQAFLTGLQEHEPADAWVAQRRQPLLCEDVLNHPRFKGAHVEAGTRCLMVAPLFVENKILGALRVESALPRRFSRDDLRVLDALSTMASLALDNAVLYHRVEQLAVRDGLTQLLTHRAFEERLEEELLRAGRYRSSVGLLMVDVDHFKRVNDIYGHSAGDDVLRRVSRKLAEMGRPVDASARYGGEEFCLLLVESSRSSALETAERFRQEISRERFESNGAVFGVTVSVGVSIYPDEATTSPQLVRLADQRLYRAKGEGRNRVVGGEAA